MWGCNGAAMVLQRGSLWGCVTAVLGLHWCCTGAAAWVTVGLQNFSVGLWGCTGAAVWANVGL